MEIKKCTVFGDVDDEGPRLPFNGVVEVDKGKARFFHSSPSNFAPKDKEGNVIGDPKINLDYCSGDNKDFGKGFYLSATAEFCNWYMQKGAKSANSGIPLNCTSYWLYDCLVNTSLEESEYYLDLTEDLAELARVCYKGRFLCTDETDVLGKHSAILGWMVDDLNFDKIKDKLVTKKLLNRHFDEDTGDPVYTGFDISKFTKQHLEKIGDLMFMTKTHGAYQLAIKHKAIVENENMVKLYKPTEVHMNKEV